MAVARPRSHHYLLLCFFFFLQLCASYSSSATLSPSFALLAFRLSLPRSSRLLIPWKSEAVTSLSHCHWLGVSCYSDSTAVRSLNLSSIGLSGDLAISFSHLSTICNSFLSLDLSYNLLSGAIPPQLGNCTRLRTLLLNSNLFTGPIPPDLFRIPQLKELDVGDNSLTGSIPLEVKFSQELEAVGFYNNFLSGEIPPEVFLLPKLNSVYLNTNNFTGSLAGFGDGCAIVELFIHENMLSRLFPSSLINCQNLMTVIASENRFEGSIPDVFHRLPELEILYLNDNKFDGILPRSLGSLSNLRELSLSGNKISGTILEELVQCQSLEILSLWGNRLVGHIPRSIGGLKNLNTLYLFENMLHGVLPAEIGNCSSLNDLRLQRNFLSGQIPAEIFRLGSLETLYLFNNHLSGRIPLEIEDLENIVDLQLYNNSLIGEIPVGVVRLRNLRLLSLAYNRLTGHVPPDLGKNTSSGLVSLDLSGNDLNGPIPSGLCTGNRLTILDLALNQLSGGIPVEIGNCSSLRRVILSNNALQGPLPEHLSLSSRISYLDLKNNLLDGRIPQTLGLRVNLSMLDISGNLLVGPVPSDLGNLHNLQVLHLSSNRLNGTIPAELGNCTKLISLDLSNNFISGNIPSDVIDLVNLQSLLLQGNKLKGIIPDSFTPLHDLYELHLGDNFLEGPIPKSLGNLHQLSMFLNLSLNKLSEGIPSSLSNLDKLQVLDLSNNNLTGEIPLQLDNMLSLSCVNISHNYLSGKLPHNWFKFVATFPNSFMGNPELCVRVNAESDCEKVTNHRKRHRLMLNWMLGVILFVVGSCIALYFAYLVWRTWKIAAFHKNLIHDNASKEDLPQHIKFEDIMRVTEDLSEKYVIGRGRHGTVYRTEFGYGQLWAVKRLPVSESSFGRELKIMTSTKHRNLIRMDGYCIKDGFGLILYEYMPCGTLFDVLHNSKPQIALDWNIRYHIALGIAQALSYLHHDCVPPIIHRDVKSSNILMDSELVPKLGDFGMAKLVESSESGMTMSSIVGTLGYIAPENGYFTKLTEKCDVYGYGVVLLELLCRKMPVDPSFADELDIVNWVKVELQKADHLSPHSFLDEEIKYWVEEEKAKAVKLLELALSCTEVAYEARPFMREVVRHLVKLN